MATKATTKQPRVSVIIPVYNCEEYVGQCLDSLYAQTYQDFELIVVNDGSTDSSLKVLEQNAKEHKNFTLINQKNHGQGYTRNMAVSKTKGEYILFVDADDYIEPTTIELAVARIESDNSDLVHFDWKMLTSAPNEPDKIEYFNTEPFAHKHLLVGDECDEFLQLNNFFSVNNLYRKSFLVDNDIRYDEGHIYEDNIFMVMVGNQATKISLIDSPLYIIRSNITSSTRTGAKTDKHYVDFLRAAKNSFGVIKPRTNSTIYYLASYFLEKFIIYYERRVPGNLKSRYLREFVDVMADINITIPSGGVPKRLLELCIRRGIFKQRKYRQFRLLILYKTVILPQRQNVVDFLQTVKLRGGR